MNDSGLREDDEDEGVEVEELEEEQQGDGGEHVSSAEPAEVEDFVKGETALDEEEGQEGFLGLGAAWQLEYTW